MEKRAYDMYTAVYVIIRYIVTLGIALVSMFFQYSHSLQPFSELNNNNHDDDDNNIETVSASEISIP